MLGPSWTLHDCRWRSIRVAEIVGELRLARFNDGLRCARCGASRVQKWGWFSHRQRYRCRGCGRTFSDLTGTPAAYIKKLDRWPLYALCFARAMTIRKSARQVSVHPSTAFRWRHRLAGALREADDDRVSGDIELRLWRYPESRKGERGLDRPPRRGARLGPFGYWRGAWDYLYLAYDRAGNVVSRVLRERSPDEWRVALGDRLDRVRALIIPHDGLFYNHVPAFADSIGVRATRGSGLEYPGRGVCEAVRRYHMRMEEWLARFRGVASKYLPNYLVWHRRVDEAVRFGMPARVLRWPAVPPWPTGPPRRPAAERPPTVPANTHE